MSEPVKQEAAKEAEVIKAEGTTEGALKGWEARKGAATAATDEAHAASAKAHDEPDPVNDEAAAERHEHASKMHSEASAEAPDEVKKKKHERMAQMHSKLASWHHGLVAEAKAGVAAKDASQRQVEEEAIKAGAPEGHEFYGNQYSQEAEAATDKAEEQEVGGGWTDKRKADAWEKKRIELHLKASDLHKKAEKEHRRKGGKDSLAKADEHAEQADYHKRMAKAKSTKETETDRAYRDWAKRKNQSSDATPSVQDTIQCRSSGIKLPDIDAVPATFQWMPAGVTTIVAHYNGKPIELTVECLPDTAETVQASLDGWREQYPKLKPFGCVEHREEEAAFWPKGFSWREEPEPGVFCSADWTSLGERNVVGKVHRSFSPSFTTDAEYAKAKEYDGVLKFPKGARGGRDNPARITGVAFSVGSLTNKPAFKNILPVKAKEAATGTKQAIPQPVRATNAAQTKGNSKMKVKLRVARDDNAAGTVLDLPDEEAQGLIKAGDAYELSVAKEIDSREAEIKTLKEQRKAEQQSVIKAKIAQARKEFKIAPKDDTYQAKCFERLEKGTDLDTICELIDNLPVQATLANVGNGGRITKPVTEGNGAAHSGLTFQGVSPGEAAKEMVRCRGEMNDLIQGKANIKEAFMLARQEAAVYASTFLPMLKKNDDMVLRDIVRAADFSDPDSQVGTLVTGLILQRNLGFLKNKLGWLPFLTTDLSGEPVKFNQPILTRYITPPNVATYIPGIGYTTDATTITNNSAQETETTGTLTKSAPSATDVTVTCNQHKGVEIEFASQRLASTVRNLFAEQQAAQFYSLAETINAFVLKTIFAATWSGTKTSYTKSLANWDIKGMVGVKNALSLSKVPDVGRFLMMHSVYHDKLLEDSNLVLANTIMAALGKSATVLETGELPPLFGVKPLESQLCSYADSTYTAITDPDSLGSVNNVGFAGTSASMVFVSRVPQDYTAIAGQMGIPATAAVEIATEPDSGLSIMFVKYVNHTLASISARCAVMYGAAQGHPGIGVVLKAA